MFFFFGTPPPKQQQGSRFFGYCCDMRTAVIVLNVLSAITFTVSLALYIGVELWHARFLKVNLDDDFVGGSLRQSISVSILMHVFSEANVAIHITLDALALIASIISFIGGIKFNAWLVVCNFIESFLFLFLGLYHRLPK